MTPSSGAASSTGSRRACWRTWTRTGGGWSRRARPVSAARRRGAVVALAAALATLPACAYLNTFYNAEQAYAEGVRLRSAAGDSLTPAARAEFERAAEKSAIVLERHADSRYADDALLLLARSFYQTEAYADAAATFRQFVARFPEHGAATEARLGLVRSERRMGDYESAEAALAPLLAAGATEGPEILYEKALIEAGTGAHEAAVATFRHILDRHPAFAREEGIALRFADAELAAGQMDAALEAYAAFRDQATDPLERRTVALRTAHALALAGRGSDAIAAYDDVLAADPPDSLAARVEAERGTLLAADSVWGPAEAALRRAAELDPGSTTAARATLARGRIVWHVQGDREAALEILLDAFLHLPTSVWADSAREEARGLARLIHFRRLSEGEIAVPGIEDPDLARATARYRFGEEVLELEDDPAAAAAIFARIAAEHPASPWRARALLAAGLLRRRSGDAAGGEEALRAVLALDPDSPEADSARHALGLDVPERAAAFYGVSSVLETLAAALPRAPDPMVRVVDQMDRYAARRAPAAAPAGGGAADAGPPGAGGAAGGVEDEGPPIRELRP